MYYGGDNVNVTSTMILKLTGLQKNYCSIVQRDGRIIQAVKSLRNELSEQTRRLIW